VNGRQLATCIFRSVVTGDLFCSVSHCCESVEEQCAEENIWTSEGGIQKEMEITAM
jgi:hypothetical protein